VFGNALDLHPVRRAGEGGKGGVGVRGGRGRRCCDRSLTISPDCRSRNPGLHLSAPPPPSPPPPPGGGAPPRAIDIGGG
jgi:hypothetical protein